MGGIINSLRNYEFLNLTKSVNEAQVELCKKPNETWAQVGNKFCKICWLNAESIGAVGADVVTYLTLSSFRKCGFLLPIPPAPPEFPTPHDNVEFIQNAIKRALWDWNPELRQEFEEGVADSLSEKWNVFQVVGEWSLVYSFENEKKSSYFKPSFLTISEPLENGESFRTVGVAFQKLRYWDQRAILDAIFHQKEPVSLSSKGKTVYQNIRGLASLLHQGNQIFTTAFREYQKQNETLLYQSDVPPVQREVPAMRYEDPYLQSDVYPIHNARDTRPVEVPQRFKEVAAVPVDAPQRYHYDPAYVRQPY